MKLIFSILLFVFSLLLVVVGSEVYHDGEMQPTPTESSLQDQIGTNSTAIAVLETNTVRRDGTLGMQAELPMGNNRLGGAADVEITDSTGTNWITDFLIYNGTNWMAQWVDGSATTNLREVTP